MKYVTGSGGGGKGGRGSSATVAEISGFSTDHAQVLMAVCEGPVQGIINNAQGVLLDDTPVQNEDGTFNFDNMTYSFVPGLLNQSIPAGSNEVSSETSVEVDVSSSASITRSILNDQINAIRLRLAFTLQEQEDDGDVREAEVRIRISVKEGTGGFNARVDQEISGRYPTPTVFQWILPVNTVGGTIDSFSVRVEKLTQDSQSNQLVNTVRFLSYAEVLWDAFEYPNTVLIWLQFPSKLFRSVPSIKIRIAGLLYPIPTNATVDPADGGLVYQGGWDGTFYMPTIAPADPCWLLHELVINERWGLGRQLNESDIDKWSLYSASVYNNEKVQDGFGGSERRYLFNGVLQGDQAAWDVITAICSNFDAKPFWGGETISVWQDRPTTELSKIITNADVEEGRFVYDSRQWKGLATVALVTWNSPDEQFQRQIEVVEDREGIELYGRIDIEFTAFGCTSRGQAVRAGRRVLLKSRLDQEQISFKARAIAAFFQPGDVILVQDNRRSQARKGGIIASATTTTITVDAPVALTGTAFKIFVTMPDLTVEERDLTNPPGSHSVLTLSAPLPAAPLAHANWIIQDFGSNIRKYRVTSVSPDRSNPVMYEVTGELYSAEKHPLIESGWSLDELPVGSQPPTIVPVPRNVTAIAVSITRPSKRINDILVSWEIPFNSDDTPNLFITSYLVEIKRQGGNWFGRQTVTQTTTRFEDVGNDSFIVRVAAVTDFNNRVSQYVESNTVVTSGSTITPPDDLQQPDQTSTTAQNVANFTTSKNSGFAIDF
ncbi:MAG: host specificity protein J [Moorea sp. SIO3I7]|uniref:TipJ family phage tail tip protein n=1 Tax=Moorena sp. SIO3I8 TaxID=2607833 RepID=UPI0013C01E34|nr:phage tail protein [Moorena sp. SIO3I8]NEN94482.1 host specificity protein J [Moorena sp. SIO3I7]NEO04928.1 host specificity protein J [Moorena sp. SIO3I8]